MDLAASPLLTDLYQLNMLQAYLDRDETKPAVFEFFMRKLPSRRGFLLTDKLLPTKEKGKFVPTPIIKSYLGIARYLGLVTLDLGEGVRAQITPSFFCRLDEEVVYWNTIRFCGKTMCTAACAISAASWKPQRISLSLPG